MKQQKWYMRGSNNNKHCRKCAYFNGQNGDWCEKYSEFTVVCPNFINKTTKRVA